MENKIKQITSIWYNTIDITFNLTYICNYFCSYCVAWERNEKIFILNEKTKEKLSYFINSIYGIKPDTKINFLLCWWEPLINKQFIDIVIFLLSFKNVIIQTTTNGFFILNLKDKIKFLQNDRFIFYMTLHFNEYIKHDKIGNKYIDTINFLKNNNIYFELNFLIPVEKELYNEFKKMMKFIIESTKLSKKEYVINLVREDWIISNKYSKEILDFYYTEKPKIVNQNKWEYIKVDYTDWTTKNLLYIKEVMESWMNNFRWYQCFPFSIPTNILMEPNLMISFASCSTMLNKKYTLEEWITLMKSWYKKNVICNTNFCECGSNLLISKKLNKTYLEKINHINDLLLKKVQKLLLIDWLIIESLTFMYDSDNKWFLLSYYNKNNPNIFINFIIEKKVKNNENKYIDTNSIFWIYYYKANNQWWFIQDEIDWLDTYKDIIVFKIKPLFPILSSLINMIN